MSTARVRDRFALRLRVFSVLVLGFLNLIALANMVVNLNYIALTVCLLSVIRTCQLEMYTKREPAIAKQCGMSPRAMQDDDLDHFNVTKSTRNLLWYSGSQLGQLMVSNTRSLCGKLVQFSRYIAIMSENPINACPLLVLSQVSDGPQVAMTACTNPKLQIAPELEQRVVRSAGTADSEIELRAPGEKLVELSSRTPRLGSSTVVRRW